MSLPTVMLYHNTKCVSRVLLRMLVDSFMRRYPDMNLPTVLLYHNTKCLQTLVGLVPYGGRTLTPERASLDSVSSPVVESPPPAPFAHF